MAREELLKWEESLVAVRGLDTNRRLKILRFCLGIQALSSVLGAELHQCLLRRQCPPRKAWSERHHVVNAMGLTLMMLPERLNQAAIWPYSCS